MGFTIGLSGRRFGISRVVMVSMRLEKLFLFFDVFGELVRYFRLPPSNITSNGCRLEENPLLTSMINTLVKSLLVAL